MERHMTVSGFVVHEGRVALHWHRKLQTWMPAGGHIEAGEDPVEAILREVREEFGLDAEVLSLGPRVPYDGGPAQIEPPVTVLLCKDAPDHDHIDFVYYLRVSSGYPGQSHDPANPIEWVDAATLLVSDSLPLGACGTDEALPPDVRALAIDSIRAAERVTAAMEMRR